MAFHNRNLIAITNLGVNAPDVSAFTKAVDYGFVNLFSYCTDDVYADVIAADYFLSGAEDDDINLIENGSLILVNAWDNSAIVMYDATSNTAKEVFKLT